MRESEYIGNKRNDLSGNESGEADCKGPNFGGKELRVEKENVGHSNSSKNCKANWELETLLDAKRATISETLEEERRLTARTSADPKRKVQARVMVRRRKSVE